MSNLGQKHFRFVPHMGIMVRSVKGGAMAAQQAFVVPVSVLWAAKTGGRTIGTLQDTQEAAIRLARKWLQDNGGGELVVQDQHGNIRAKDTIFPGNDPRNIRG